MNSLIPFQKEYQHADALVQLLLSRGLAIDNPDKAERYLKTINDKLLSLYLKEVLKRRKNSTLNSTLHSSRI